MTCPNFHLLSPFGSIKNTLLPKLQDPVYGQHGKIEMLSGGFKRMQYCPSDHPISWKRLNNSGLNVRSSHFCHEPYTDETEILYTLNNLNYRTNTNFDKEKPGLMSLGCSHTYGVGVRDNEAWPQRLADSLNLPNWNLGCGAQSVDYCVWIARAFFNLGYIPKAVAVWWPELSRNITTTSGNVDNDVMSTIISRNEDINKVTQDIIPITASNPWADDVQSKIVGKGHFAKSELQHIIEFIMKREYIIQLCNIHNVPIVEYYGSILLDNFCFAEELTERSVYQIPKVVLVNHGTKDYNYHKSRNHIEKDWDPLIFEETARDGLHRSGTFMKELADRFEISFKQNYADFK